MNKTFFFSLSFSFLCILGTFLFSCSQDGEGGYWKSIPGDGNLQAVTDGSSNSQAYCGETPYDSATKRCCGSSIYNPENQACCEGTNILYNSSTQTCKNGEVSMNNSNECADVEDSAIEQCCNGRRYSLETSFCSNGIVLKKCGDKEYNPLAQFCYDIPGYIAVIEKCGGEDYNPTEQKCCGSSTYNPSTKACCGGNALYSPSTQICKNGEVSVNNSNECEGRTYEPATQECCNNKILTKSTQFCSDGNVKDKCGSSEYDPSLQFCSNGTILNKCGDKVYTPPNQQCNESNNLVETKCGNDWFDATKYFCSTDNNIFPLCGSSEYNPSLQFCSNGTILNKCGGKTFDTATQKCDGTTVKTKCGESNWYDAATQFCSNGTPVNRCGGMEYNPATQTCVGTTVKSTCGTTPYDPATQFCQSSNVVKDLCGGKEYTAAQFCSSGKVYDKCGVEPYDPTEEACCVSEIYKPSVKACCKGPSIFKTYNSSAQICNIDGTVTPLVTCGGAIVKLTEQCCADKILTTATQFCYNGNIINKCGGSEYNLSTHFCYNGKPESLCGTAEYNPDNQKCEGGIVKTKCGSGDWYDANEKLCDKRNNKIYKSVKIGTQTWMAENLNYQVEGSKCGNANDSLSDANTTTCDTYGRLYSWATALKINPSCNTSSCGTTVSSKHQGICPEGWHIPTYTEWTTLTDYAGGSVAGTKLKATSGWKNCSHSGSSYSCLDSYGFSALPGGYGNSDGTTFNNVGHGTWWTSTEYSANYAMSPRMSYYLDNVFYGSDGKILLSSVRCLKD